MKTGNNTIITFVLILLSAVLSGLLFTQLYKQKITDSAKNLSGQVQTNGGDESTRDSDDNFFNSSRNNESLDNNVLRKANVEAYSKNLQTETPSVKLPKYTPGLDSHNVDLGTTKVQNNGGYIADINQDNITSRNTRDQQARANTATVQGVQNLGNVSNLAQVKTVERSSNRTIAVANVSEPFSTKMPSFGKKPQTKAWGDDDDDIGGGSGAGSGGGEGSNDNPLPVGNGLLVMLLLIAGFAYRKIRL